MHLPSPAAFAKTRLALALAGAASLATCTPRAGEELARAESEPIIGITESIAERPVVDVDPAFASPAGFSESGPVSLGAFRTTAAQEARIDSLLAAMTLEEKAGQMNQYTSFYDVTGPPPQSGTAEARFRQVREGLVGSMLNVSGAANTRKIQELALESRLGIPVLFAFDVIHGFRQQFPVPLAEAATWDTALVEQGARWAAREASAYGLHWTFAPMVDVSPDARWGRIVEGAGEDPYLGSLVAAARVRGFQGDDLADPTTVAACAKHFAGYGYSGGGRDYNAVDVSPYTLHNDVLPPFRAAAEAGAATFMNGFHTIGGLPVTGNRELQRGWLKAGMQWPGMIVSDWGSIAEIAEHGAAVDLADAARRALEAGSDMDMEATAYVQHVPALVRDGTLDEALVDDAVRRILRVKTALGLFDDPFRYCDPAREAAVATDAELRAAAVETAAASAVLLQNRAPGGREDAPALLPLGPAGEILVVGDLAGDKDSPLGTWSLAAERGTAVSLLEALRAATGRELAYEPGPATLVPGSPSRFVNEVTVNTRDRSGFADAVAAARRAATVVLALGEPAFMSGEARSRTSLGLPGFQQELAEAVLAANPRTVVVLYSGRPLAIERLAEVAPSILLAWQPGSYGNEGIAEVLLGRRAPRGKLPVSFPYVSGQEPLTYRHFNTGRPARPGRPDSAGFVFDSHYMDAPWNALYPFGHGLTYTSWNVTGVAAQPAAGQPAGQRFTVTAELTNSGQRAGTQTVQLYMRDPVAQRVRPVRELKGFQQVTLAPGATETVRFAVGPETLRYWSPEDGWHVEPGDFEFYVGTSSTELSGPARVRVGKRDAP